MEDLLILVDENDNEIGSLDKLSAHRSGALHRAFSIFIFNSKGELLIQQRADGKYHSAGLWSNTCCSHPKYGEEISNAVSRRLVEEMGMQCKTEFKFSFIYKISFENGLIEHEYDYVFFGVSDDLPNPNPGEAKAWRYINLNELQKEIKSSPERFTAWLQICLPKVIEHFNQNSVK